MCIGGSGCIDIHIVRKRISVPELGLEIPAVRGFNLIATANTRDRGVNDMSAALKDVST
jgi:MoxR-like ATPase